MPSWEWWQPVHSLWAWDILKWFWLRPMCSRFHSLKWCRFCFGSIRGSKHLVHALSGR
jgi:hypothetical protein